MEIYGGIEAGGTKFVCAVGFEPGRLLHKASFKTTSWQETLEKSAQFFTDLVTGQNFELKSIGIASFGPLDLDHTSEHYGTVINSPKVGWNGVNLRRELEQTIDVPVKIDTDVNGAALAEYKLGAGRGSKLFVYYTIGTGIGASIFHDGKPLHGKYHNEMGHVILPQNPVEDSFLGCCPYHGNCLEGLASGTAMQQRWGVIPEVLPRAHPGWQLEAKYIAKALHNTWLSFTPEKIILGGGVMHHPGLLEKVRLEFAERSASYPVQLSPTEIENLLVAPALGDDAGIHGALLLAMLK